MPIKKLKKGYQKFAMSKGVGKVLDSRVGKAGVKVGNKVKKVAGAPFKWVGGQIEKEMRMNKAKDDFYRLQGKKLNSDYSGRSY